jgi:hypothetical protein
MYPSRAEPKNCSGGRVGANDFAAGATARYAGIRGVLEGRGALVPEFDSSAAIRVLEELMEFSCQNRSPAANAISSTPPAINFLVMAKSRLYY